MGFGRLMLWRSVTGVSLGLADRDLPSTCVLELVFVALSCRSGLLS
jgi:hypothetical protein